MKPSRSGFVAHRGWFSLLAAATLHMLLITAAAAQPGAGTALDLDGLNDYVDTGIVWNMAAAPITVEMWAYLPSSAGGAIFGQEGNFPSTWSFFFLSRGPNEVQLWTHGGSGHVAQFVNHPTDRWTHLVIQVRDSGPFLKRIYFDLQAGVDGLREGLVANYLSFLIGGRNRTTGPVDFARMKVDEVRIWNRIVPESELREKMHRRLDPSTESGLLAYYRFDDASGAVAANAAGVNDGALFGAPAWLLPSTAPIGDRSNVGTGTAALSENADVAVDLTWDDDPGSSALFAAIQVNDQPFGTSGLTGTIPHRYWELWMARDDGAFQADATVHFDGLFGPIEESGLRLFTRPEAGGTWTEVTDVTLDEEGNPSDGSGSLTANDVTAFSQFIVTFAATNQAPTADAGPDQVIDCAAATGVAVMLDGTASADLDGDPLSYTWTGPFPEGGGTVSGPTPTVTLGAGVHTIALVVDDGNGGIDENQTTVAVAVDVTPPALSLEDGGVRLWPPNHKLHTIVPAERVSAVTDNCDTGLTASAVFVTSVTSDEAEDGAGDGNTLSDVVVAGDCRAVDVRAERDGRGNGRVYTIHLSAVDAAGNTGDASFQVHVPHDPKGDAVDDGVAYAKACAASVSALKDGFEAPVQAVNGASNSLSAGEAPRSVILHRNYPNPFNPVTTLAFELPEAAHVRLLVYDVLGREVARLADGYLNAGRHEVRFEATQLSGGTYVAELMAGPYRITTMMVVLK